MNEETLLRLLAKRESGRESVGEFESTLMRSLISRLALNEGPKLPPEELANLLTKRYEELMKPFDFKPGQLVMWKKGLKNRTAPQEGQPAIVVTLLNEPIVEHNDQSGSPYFREPLDLVLGLLDPDGDFIHFHFDKRRFEPYQPQAKK